MHPEFPPSGSTMAESPLPSSRARWQPISWPRMGADTTATSSMALTASSTVAQWSRIHCAHSRLLTAPGVPAAAKSAEPRYRACAARPAEFTASVVPLSHMLRPTTPYRDSQAVSPDSLLVPCGTAHRTGSSLMAQSMVRDTTLATLLPDQNTLVHIFPPYLSDDFKYQRGAWPPVTRGSLWAWSHTREAKDQNVH